MILSCGLLITGCGSTHRAARIQTMQEVIITHDSTIVTYRDSVTIIPVETSMNVGIDSSHLETSLAVSDAWTDSLGLHHRIGNKPGALLRSKSEVIYIIRDSIHEIPKPYPVEVQVPAELKSWQKSLIGLGGFSFVFLVIFFIIKLKS